MIRDYTHYLVYRISTFLRAGSTWAGEWRSYALRQLPSTSKGVVCWAVAGNTPHKCTLHYSCRANMSPTACTRTQANWQYCIFRPLTSVGDRHGIISWGFVCLYNKHNTTQHNTTQHNTTQHILMNHDDIVVTIVRVSWKSHFPKSKSHLTLSLCGDFIPVDN